MENLETNAVKEPDLVANADLLALAAPESFHESANSTAQGNFQSTTPEKSMTVDTFNMESAIMSAPAGQSLSGINMNFFVGLRAELLPNSGDVWYPITILDMDVEEREVLCHYENSQSSDEWVCVDSCRIRPITVKPAVKPEFQINQKVMATWNDNRKFPAVVKTIFPDGSYEVLFMDGFKKTLKPHKLTKFTRKDQEHFQKNYTQTIPSTPPIVIPSAPFGSDMLSKEERRKRKRKLNVKDLFTDHRKKTKQDDSLVVKKAAGDEASLKMVISRKKPDESVVMNSPLENSASQMNYSSLVTATPPSNNSPIEDESSDGHKRKRIKNRKADYDYETSTFASTKKSADNSAQPILYSAKPAAVRQPLPSDGAPPSEVPYQRIPKLVIDNKLPPGWSKYCVLKKCGTKYDVYIQSPEGRKCRSRNEIQAIYHEKGEVWPMEKFDFMLGESSKRKFKKKHRRDSQGNILSVKLPFHKPESSLNKTPLGSSTPVSTPIDPGRRIKTLLPKAKIVEPAPATPVAPVPAVVSTPISSSSESGSAAGTGGTSGASATTGSGGAGCICPIQNCGKLFRSENYLAMHVKHYHAEYNQILGTTPNVADLAYARTVGQSIDDVSPSTSFLDKLNQLEKQKAAASQSPASAVSPQSVVSIPSPSRKKPENEVNDERILITDERKVIPPPPRRISEPCQSIKPCSNDSPDSENKEPTVLSLEPSPPVPAEPDSERYTMNGIAKKQPMAAEIPKRRRFSKYGSSSLDGDSASVSGKTGKKRTTSTSKSSTVSDYNESSLDASESGTESSSVIVSKIEQLKKEEVINCTCGYKEEDGLMIQCDLCLCWQHGHCNDIETEDEVPEKYICKICLNPAKQRLSRKYTYNQDWLKEGTLPRFSFRPRNNPELVHRESLLKRSHSVTATLVQLETVLHSLQAKINVAEKTDHPKLYLWSKPWNEDKLSKEKVKQEIKEEPDLNFGEGAPLAAGNIPGPEPEAPIDPIECRQRLLDHIDNYQNQVESRLTSLEAQIAALESEDPDLANDETPDFYPQTKQTIQMVMKDLQTVRRIATLS
nr:PREDICTED: PHD finger protein 20 isoform X1 [Bemisia tabaci]